MTEGFTSGELAWMRRGAAERAYAAYEHGSHYTVPAVGDFVVSRNSSDPANTLHRQVTLRWQGKDYTRVFAVVFVPGTLEVAQSTFGDLLP